MRRGKRQELTRLMMDCVFRRGLPPMDLSSIFYGEQAFFLSVQYGILLIIEREKLMETMNPLFSVDGDGRTNSLEIIVGYSVGSLALVADSFHMLNDVMSLIVALYALKVGNPPCPAPSSYLRRKGKTSGKDIPLSNTCY